MARLIDIESIKTLFKKDNYLVLSTKYTHSKQKISYKCPDGHLHSMRLDHWRRGVRCPYCSDKFKKSIEYIRPFFALEGYNLISDTYIDANTKLHLVCPEGHDYYTSWHNWKSGNHRCSKCNGGIRLDASSVNNVFSKEGYTMVGAYGNCHSPIECQCPEGHTYLVTFGNFTSKNTRCTECSGNGASSGEIMLRDHIKSLGVVAIYNNRKLITPLELDIVIPSKKIAIEYCGLYWHSELNGKDRKYHLNKLNLCQKIGYKLITIFEDELLSNKEIVFSRLTCLLSKTTSKVYARKCSVRQISPRLAKEFCSTNHMQGYGAGAYIKLGAFYKNNLVAVMTFAKPSIAKGYNSKLEGVYELHRFCSVKDTIVVGIASKLFKYFLNNFKFNTLFSYADRRWSTGNVYTKLGFVFNSYTRPNYWYIKGKRRINRFSLRKTVADNQDITEWENRRLAGYDRIWDCGNLKYVYKKGD